MKKKFYGALVLGSVLLAGGMVSCSDYDDDIDSLNNRVTAVEQTVKELQDKINAGAVITDVQTVENGVKVTLSDGSSFTLVNGKDGSAGSVVTMGSDGYWYIDGQKTENPWKGEKGDKGDQGDPGTSGTTAPSKYYVPNEDGYWYVVNVAADGTESAPEKTDSKWAPEGMMTAAWDTQNEVLLVYGVKDHDGVLRIDLGTNLKGLVFVPSLYMEGIEGTRYPYVEGRYKEATGSASGTVATTNVKYSIPDKNVWQESFTAYTIGAKDTVIYHMNPTSAKVDDAEFQFLYDAPEMISRSGDEGSLKVNYLANEKTKEGDLKVAYQISNPYLLESKQATGTDKVSVMALEVKLGNDTTITSDYAAIVPAVRTLRAIAFNSEAGTTTNQNKPYCDYDLYKTGEAAVINTANVTVQYNNGPIDLSKLLNIHYVQTDWVTDNQKEDVEHNDVMSYEEAQKFGLHFEYEILKYTTGAHETEEDKYGKVDALTGKFTPCYVNEQGTSVECPTDGVSTTGISAVGREPVVIVKLVNETGNVVLAGYIKINIVKKISELDFVVKSEDEPYVCGKSTWGITWDDMSGKIVEKLQMTKEEFRNSYDMVENETYIKKDGKFIKVTNNVYGDLTYIDDTQVPTTNDIFTWTMDFDERTNISKEVGRTVTLYARFNSKTSDTDVVYIGLTTTILAQPEITFGDKIEKYWYPANKDLAERDFVRMNVPRPTSSTKPEESVTYYVKDLNDYYEGNEVKLTPTAAAQNSSYDLTALGTAYHYEFSEVQPKIGAYQLYRAQDNVQRLMCNEQEVAKINPNTGVLTYASTDMAKAVLNAYGHEEADEKANYANVDIKATYDDCELALGETSFKVRFLRPVDILEGEDATFEDAEANGSSVILGKLFGLEDWRDVALLKKSGNQYVSNVENNCDLYNYYKFGTIKIDIANAQSDLTGTMKPISEVTDKLELYVDVDGQAKAANTSVEVNIANVAALNTTKIVYKNNEGNVQEFNLIIPIEINYSWGTLKGEIKAVVKSTKAN